MHLTLPVLKFHLIPCLMSFGTVIFLRVHQAIEIYVGRKPASDTVPRR